MIARIKGFTLVELIVVIATIGILASIVLIGLNRYQADTRDARRASSVSVISEALEKYYDANGEYPSCSALTAAASTVTSATLKGLNKSVLLAPQASGGDNSLKCGTALTVNGADFFEYVGDGSSTCLTGTACVQYTLKYIEEGSNSIVAVESRHKADLATSLAISDLVATTFSFSQINLDWSDVGGATSYTVQRATNNTFSTGLIESSVTASNASATGLAVNTTYYFRVKPLNATSTGVWSNVANAVTYSLDTPTGVATANSPANQISFSWNSVANATSYTVEYATNSSFTSATSTSNATSPKVVSSVASGTTLYFRVKAIASSYTSGWSATVSATVVSDPAPYTISSNWDGTYLNATANSVCAAGTTATFYWYVNGGAWVNGDGYRSVSYAVPYNQPITLTVNTRCYTAAENSNWVAATNSAYYNRPAVVIQGIQKVSGGSSNGHRVWVWWNNLCGGTNQIIGYQGGYNTGWIYPNWNTSNNPAAGASSMPGSTNDTRNWNSGGTVTYYARQDCGGWQQSVNSASIYA